MMATIMATMMATNINESWQQLWQQSCLGLVAGKQPSPTLLLKPASLPTEQEAASRIASLQCAVSNHQFVREYFTNLSENISTIHKRIYHQFVRE